MNNKIISIVIVLALIVLGFFLFKDRTEAPAEVDSSSAGGTYLEGSEDAGKNDTPELDQAGSVKEFTVEASNFAYAMKSLTVNEGDIVKINLMNTQGMHDLKIDEFGVATKVLSAGQSETIQFVASKKGTFEYYCSVGTHRQMGMVGALIVQ